MNGTKVRISIADYASDPMVMAITAIAEDDEFDTVLSVNIGSSIGNGTLMNLMQGATTIERNGTIGGHRAGEEK